MNNSVFSLSLFFLFIILFFIKLVVIYISYVNLSPFKYCLAHFISDYYFLLIIVFFIAICFYSKNKIIKYWSNIINLLLIIIYCIDIFSIYYFQTRGPLLTLFSMGNWDWHWWFGLCSLIILYVFILIIWIIIINFIVYRHILNIKKFFNKILSSKCFLLYCFLWVLLYYIQPIIIKNNIPNVKNILSTNIETKNVQESKKSTPIYKKYEDYIKYESGDNKKLNVVLIFLESFSAIDSARLWWNNNTPYLDKIQENWVTFPNFFSNWLKSHHAHVWVLLWIPPIKEDYDYNFSFLNSNWLANFLNKQWYYTTFISTVPLSFFDQRTFLYWVWFKKIIWEEEFQKRKKYAFNAAPDGDLYNRVLQEVQNQTWKFFIWLQTISFHRPYNTPLWKTENLALKYSDQELYRFYQWLCDLWFFDNWILIIVWDHRKRTPAEKWEYSIFWPMWKWKSIVTVIWTWIKAWSINDNFIQHTDFYHSIKKLLWNKNVETNIFYNDIFSPIKNRDWGIIDNASIWSPIDDTMFFSKVWDDYDIDYNHNNIEAYNYYLFLKDFLLKD